MEFEKLYEDAVASGLLPGFALIAGNTDGKILYSKAMGKQSLKPGVDRPFQLDTMCAVASMTKLMTAVAALQCVEDGLLDLDKPVSSILPEIGKYGIITGFDDEANQAITTPNETTITLRMLLSHTSGHEYDWFNPLLGKWRASRNEIPFGGATIEQKATLPLVFKPGTSFTYGPGLDWTGKMIERVSGETLETYMSKKIWSPLGTNDITFYPRTQSDKKDRIADISTLSQTSEGPAVDAPDFDLFFGATDCLGGGGAFASAEGYFTFLNAVLKRDSRLLKQESWTELFKPQLNEQCEQAFNDYLVSSPAHEQFLGMSIPPSIRKTWSFAGMICLDGEEGRMSKNTIFWGGVPSTTWYLDIEAGICGVAACQIVPPMAPPIIRLHEQFQRAMFKAYA